MKSKIFSLCVVFVVLSVSSAQAKAKSGNLTGSIFGNCARLNKVYPRGVAISSSKARLQKVKPAINRGIYLKNIKLDRDKDGTACEQSRSSSRPANPSYPSGPNVVGTLPVSCATVSSNLTMQNVVHRTTGSRQTSSFYGVSSTFEVSREVSGQIMNSSAVEVSITSIISKSLYRNGLNNGSPTYEANNSVTSWIPVSQYSIAANSKQTFSYSYTQYVVAPYGAFMDSFDSSIESKMYTLNPRCDFVK
jgi:hypothetical protein